MGRPLLERLALAHKSTSRISDCKRDLAEAEAERSEIEQRIADCERRSEDPSTPDDEAQLAHRQAADWKFHAKRLDRAIADVRETIAAKLADESHVERRKTFEAAEASRDALVERWNALGPVWDGLITLLADTAANDALIAQINRQRPHGEPALRSAELEARGALNEERWPNSIGQGGEPFQRLTALEWPNLTKPGLAWSLREAERRTIAAQTNRDGAVIAAAAAAREAANTPEAARAKAEADRYAHYRVAQARYGGAGRIRVVHRDGIAGIGNEAANLWLDVGQVDAAKAAGLAVTEAESELAR